MHGLAVEREIEAFALDLVGDAQSDENIDDLEIISDTMRRSRHDRDAVELIEHLHRVAIETGRVGRHTPRRETRR